MTGGLFVAMNRRVHRERAAMAVGFSVVGRADAAQFELFGVDLSRPYALVSFHQAASGAAVLMGRLYYRAKTEKVSTPVPSLAEIALNTYFAHGIEGVTKLEGDFCLVIYDARARRLIACRDPMGGYPLFWTTRDDVVTVSTSMRPLATGSPREQIDVDFIAEFLMQHGPGRDEMDSERCAFRGVHRLRPGSTLDVSLPANGELRQQRYWNWADRVAGAGESNVQGSL